MKTKLNGLIDKLRGRNTPTYNLYALESTYRCIAFGKLKDAKAFSKMLNGKKIETFIHKAGSPIGIYPKWLNVIEEPPRKLKQKTRLDK
jgi:hypothetical protein